MPDSDKATIKRHLEESSADIPLAQIHRELMEVFQHKGKYSLPQITAVTSWLKSQRLQGRRKEDVDWQEDFGDTSEDIDYDTTAKVKSREWHFGNFVKHTTADQRSKMKLLLLPGRNSYDYEAALKSGFSPENLIAYMRGDNPAANAEFIRNARNFGVVHKRIGDLETELSSEDQTIQAAYLDFFGQYCPSYYYAIQQLPIDANSRVFVSVNVMEGREHGKTVANLQAFNALSERYEETKYIYDHNQSRLRMAEIAEAGKKNPIELRQARARVLLGHLFASVGVANTKNWLMYEEILKFVQSCGGPDNFEDLAPCEKFRIVGKMLERGISMYSNSVEQFHEAGISADLVLLGGGVRIAVVNSPQIVHVEPPDRYVSPNGNRPFISNFGVLETHRKHYAQFEPAISFFLKIASDGLSRVMRKEKPGYFDAIQTSSGKMLRAFTPNGKLISSFSIDKLIEAQFGLSDFPNTPESLGISKEKWEGMLKERGDNYLKNQARKKIERKVQKVVKGAVGRNDLCPCGSGRKYKKCCLRNN